MKKISFEEALAIANSEIADCDDMEIMSAIELDNTYLFCPGIKEDQHSVPQSHIAIDKFTGEEIPFLLPDEENFEKLEHGKVIFDYYEDDDI